MQPETILKLQLSAAGLNTLMLAHTNLFSHIYEMTTNARHQCYLVWKNNGSNVFLKTKVVFLLYIAYRVTIVVHKLVSPEVIALTLLWYCLAFEKLFKVFKDTYLVAFNKRM